MIFLLDITISTKGTAEKKNTFGTTCPTLMTLPGNSIMSNISTDSYIPVFIPNKSEKGFGMKLFCTLSNVLLEIVFLQIFETDNCFEEVWEIFPSIYFWMLILLLCFLKTTGSAASVIFSKGIQMIASCILLSHMVDLILVVTTFIINHSSGDLFKYFSISSHYQSVFLLSGSSQLTYPVQQNKKVNA